MYVVKTHNGGNPMTGKREGISVVKATECTSLLLDSSNVSKCGGCSSYDNHQSPLEAFARIRKRIHPMRLIIA
jgi:hypothetical protein